jgi:putative nucleotidyltransferase with HDIG domain
MTDPVRFLNAFAHVLAVMTLYPEGHPSREGAVDAAFEGLSGLRAPKGPPTFTFLEDEVVFGREPLRELKAWEFGRRLIAAGIQRIEFERTVSRDQFEGFLQEILARLTLSSIATGEARQMRSLGARFGSVGLQGDMDIPDPVAAMESTTLEMALGEEAESFRSMQAAVQSGQGVPLIEAEAVVWSLAVAMHGQQRIVMPLLQLKEFDQYTTAHSLNVSVLSMALAESLGYGAKQVRSVGVAGLLHDIGKVSIPIDVLTKPGKLTAEERLLMNQHPVEGARIILRSGDEMELAATVAYEHHIMLNGGGYPTLHYKRACGAASRLVHVCDVYDALCTRRPYREAWTAEKAVGYLESLAGQEFDPDIVATFVRTLRQGDAQVKMLTEETTAAAGGSSLTAGSS